MNGGYIHQSKANYQNTLSAYGSTKKVNVERQLDIKLMSMQKDAKNKEKKIAKQVLNKSVITEADVENLINPDLLGIQREIDALVQEAMNMTTNKKLDIRTRFSAPGKRKEVIKTKAFETSQANFNKMKNILQDNMNRMLTRDLNNDTANTLVKRANNKMATQLAAFNREKINANKIKKKNKMRSIGVSTKVMQEYMEAVASIMYDLKSKLTSELMEEMYQDVIEDLKNPNQKLKTRKVYDKKGEVKTSINILKSDKVKGLKIERLDIQKIANKIMRRREFKDKLLNSSNKASNVFLYVLGNQSRFGTDSQIEKEAIQGWIGKTLSDLLTKNLNNILGGHIHFYEVNGVSYAKSSIIKKLRLDLKQGLDFVLTPLGKIQYKAMDREKNEATSKKRLRDKQFYSIRYPYSNKYFVPWSRNITIRGGI